MANLKSAKKQAKRSEVKRKRNLARKTAIKTAVKKVLTAISSGADVKETRALLKDAEAKLARAKSKRVMHSNAASRKISRLAKRINQAEAAQK